MMPLLMVIPKILDQKFKQNVKNLPFLCSGRDETVKILIDRGADVHSTNDFGESPLNSAAANGNYKRIGSEILAKCQNSFFSPSR